MNRLLIIGPPGAGKGTQATRIAEELGIPAISTGDIFRKNISEQTELGREAKSYIDAGNLVPDEVTNRMVRDRLGQDDARDGFLLDGYPRNTAQVQELDAILEELGQSLDRVLLLTADDDELVQRLLGRAAEQGRSDDTEEVIRHRLDVYRAETAPIIGLYEQRGLVARVDGLGTVQEVAERLLAALGRS
ncbi:adenylate kinase [Rothia kristinae]|uniref:adenylate kinase n=1 Tax=Rothia kristinae TaxID=37923 RepID=UPI0022E8C54C|nr:adenylate kinase [Rothia kristinae]